MSRRSRERREGHLARADLGPDRDNPYMRLVWEVLGTAALAAYIYLRYRFPRYSPPVPAEEVERFVPFLLVGALVYGMYRCVRGWRLVLARNEELRRAHAEDAARTRRRLRRRR